MPIVTVDGKRYNVADTDPKTIERAVAKRKSIKSSSDSVIGDIGRGFVAGAVSIPQGLATLPTTGIDLLFDTDVTDDINFLKPSNQMFKAQQVRLHKWLLSLEYQVLVLQVLYQN